MGGWVGEKRELDWPSPEAMPRDPVRLFHPRLPDRSAAAAEVGLVEVAVLEIGVWPTANGAAVPLAATASAC